MIPSREKSALVTGGTGFVGSHLVRQLLAEGFGVHLLCRPQSDFWRLNDLMHKCERHVGALEDCERLRQIVVAAQPQFVFHLASATVVAGSAAAKEQLVMANLFGTVNLLDACNAVDYRGLVVAGDSFEYAASHAPLYESDCPRPINLHGITKLGATLYAQMAARSRPIIILRLFSSYGPHDNPRRLVPRVIDGALAATPLMLSRPNIVRDWVYVDDVVGLFLEAAHRARSLAGGVFNAGSGIPTDLATIVATILRLTGSRAEPKWGMFPAPEHDDYPWVADPHRTFSAFQWRPATTLEAGLRSTIEAVRGRPVQ
jgi:nucleoside-diphosphate-sugar epimerase